MSTRCQMAVYKNEIDPVEKPADGVFIYRHSDGYPESVIPTIIPFLCWFNRQRGIDDSSYATARLLAHMIKEHDEWFSSWQKENPKSSSFGSSDGTYGDVLGYGVDDQIHGDIEYFYHISPTILKVYEVAYDKKKWEVLPSKHWKVLETHTLQTKKEETSHA